ncbi:trypsin-like peptidase domain-containing protein [Tenacibaculum sp. MEBiC06402]|uniref:trypsin-like peptidase domain-containing protein n=1 Tax=unclassified Tenacibaculum TaxID=2635139 RepID=UPI003B9B3669
MKKYFFNVVFCTIIFLFFLNANSQKIIKIGEEFETQISSRSAYQNQPKKNQGNFKAVFRKQFKSKNSAYIKLFFEDFDLAPEDYVKIIGRNTRETLIYGGSGKVINEKNETISNFWSGALFEDTIEVILFSNGNVLNHKGFTISKVAYGFSQEKINKLFAQEEAQQRAVCGSNDRERIACYKGTEMFEKSKAVCRMLVGGIAACTGWLLGSDGHLMTNNHCMSSDTGANGTDFIFNYQYENCTGSTSGRQKVYRGGAVVKTNKDLDYTLIKLKDNPTTEFGYLSLSPNKPSVGDRIYIPQHPRGARKEISVNSDTDNGFAVVECVGNCATPNAPLKSIRYNADTQGGSSGSPVLDYNSNLVIAIHNTGECPNGSYGRCDQLIVDIGSDMPTNGIGGGADPNPDPDPDPDPIPDPVCTSIINTFPYSESFEANEGWTQSTGDDGNWLRDTSGTPSSSTGPRDANDGDYYMYLEASTSGTGQIGSNATAILESPCFDVRGLPSAEFTFDTHMYGSRMGSLSLDVSVDGVNWNTLWSATGDQGNQWNSIIINLNSYLGEEELKLRFVGVTGSSYLSDMALDNLKLNSKLVDPDPQPICNSVISSFPYSESFEVNDGWIQIEGDDGNWLRDASGTPSSSTGPSNANNGSYYMYLEASTSGTGQIGSNATAIIESPCFDISELESVQFSFDNHMYGSSMGTLSLEASKDGVNWDVLWSDSGNQGSQWRNVIVDLNSYLGETQLKLRFIGTTGTSYLSDMAIDNLRLTSPVSNPDPNPNPTCPSLNFNDYSISSFADQDASGEYSIEDNGASLTLLNNTWKYIDMNYTVTSNTVIEFEFSSSSQGEIHGVGFENDNGLTSSRYFKVHGTQSYGITNYDNYTSGTVKYSIPIGNFYTGNMDRLVFVNDNDGGTNNNSTFSNVRIYEGSCENSSVLVNEVFDLQVPILGNEDEVNLNFIVLPNPIKRGDLLRIKEYNAQNLNNSKYIIVNVLGQIVVNGNLKQGNFISTNVLEKGLYILKIDSGSEIISKQIIVK